MSKRKYEYQVSDINELAKHYPKAVTEKHIPARVELKPNHGVISKLLDCGVDVPGIVMNPAIDDESLRGTKVNPSAEGVITSATKPEHSKSDVPAFLGKQKANN